VAPASARLESTFSLLAALGSAVHESGKRLAAQCTTTSGFALSENVELDHIGKTDTVESGPDRLPSI
jgi:hypothetical protein